VAGVALALSLAPILGQGRNHHLADGALTDRSLSDLILAGPLILGGLALLMTLAPALDALTWGRPVQDPLGLILAAHALCWP